MVGKRVKVGLGEMGGGKQERWGKGGVGSEAYDGVDFKLSQRPKIVVLMKQCYILFYQL